MPTTYAWTGSVSASATNNANLSPSGTNLATNDSLTFDQNAVGPLSGSSTGSLTGTKLANLNITGLCSQAITIGDLGTAFQIGFAACYVGAKPGGVYGGGGAGRINLDAGTNAFNLTVLGTASSGVDNGLEPMRIKGSNATNTANILGGTVGFATNAAADTATIYSLNVEGGASPFATSPPVVNVASGVTLTNLLLTGGTVNLNCAATSVVQTGGSLNLAGAGTIGSIAVVNGTADFTACGVAKTVTTCKLYAGAVLRVNNNITFTNPIQLVQCTLSDVTIVTVPPNVSLAIAYL